MKVETKEFSPVVITLETLEELQGIIQLIKEGFPNVGYDTPADKMAKELALILSFDLN